MLGEQLDAKVKNYIQALRSAGTPIGSSIVMAAGECIVRVHDRTQLMQHGGHIQITKTCMGSVIAKEDGVCKVQGHHQVNTEHV